MYFFRANFCGICNIDSGETNSQDCMADPMGLEPLGTELREHKGGRPFRECASSLHMPVSMTMTTKAKCNQVIRFIVSKSTAVFEMMNLKITHRTAYLAPPTIPL
jgi:hypothetical protein